MVCKLSKGIVLPLGSVDMSLAVAMRF